MPECAWKVRQGQTTTADVGCKARFPAFRNATQSHATQRNSVRLDRLLLCKNSVVNCPLGGSEKPPDNIFALPAEVFSSCLTIVSAVMVGGLFLWPALRYGTGYQTVWEIRPSAETPSSVYYFQLTHVHSALKLSGRCALQIYFLTLRQLTLYANGKKYATTCVTLRCVA